ncbi:MAG: PAS domain-containing protein [Myxococcaceae bacterium]|nr:PAS domain-containing protein [Myxococcaceae bacterium]MCA3015754.1 PAS domain-containing protein [Myxococcaceae bacterium]
MSGVRAFLDSITHEQLLDRLNLALEGAGVGIWDWDLRDDTVQFDRRWCEMLGLDHASTPMQLETWRARVHPDDLEACTRDIRAHVEGKTARYENLHRMRHADGRWVFILDRGQISGRDELGRPVRFTGTHADVTALERAKEVLAAEGAQLVTLVATLPTGVVMLDREGRLLSMSGQWVDQPSRPLTELLGRPFGEVLPGATRWAAPIARALEGHSTHVDEEPLTDGGRTRFLRWDARPWRTTDGAVGGVLLSAEDVTGAVQRRAQLARERETRMATLSLFAGGVAHEINTPLQVVVLEAELVLRELMRPTPSLEAIAQSAQAIAETARRAGAITRALRTLSRDARADPPDAVAIGPLFRDVQSLCLSRFTSAGVRLELDDRSGDALAVGRAAELLHALLNLLHNAHDAARGRPDAWVRLEAAVRDGQLCVRCVDSGLGVPPALLDRLMDPFFSTKPAGEGTGLGLSITRALAERDGGSLRHVPGAPHTTFELCLPLASHR